MPFRGGSGLSIIPINQKNNEDITYRYRLFLF